jgi:CO/xanthine dehydrogenase FAD-binding subunit
LAGDISPIDDLRSTAKYRLKVAQELIGEMIGKMT